MFPTRQEDETALDEVLIPLMFMLVRGREAFARFQKQLNMSDSRLAVFDGGPLASTELVLWARWSNDIFIPQNNEMLRLLFEKIGIIGNPMPSSFYDFIKYQRAYEGAMSHWIMTGEPYNHPGNFPSQFERDVVRLYLDTVTRLRGPRGPLG